MDTQSLALLAGTLSTLMFVSSNFPMLLKAFKTQDLRSYSLTHIALSNLGNLIHWVYVASLPVGPIWFLHGFFTVTTALMLLCYVRFQRRQSAGLHLA
ncbi:MAG: hypothetical protein HY870_10005 [Chloroflexi bacterium]|nr:hypothetical protein [Chloroflexota bacterium]